MRRANLFFLFLSAILLVLVIVALLARIDVPSQFYIWEFRIDLKPILFLGGCYFFARRFSFQFVRIGAEIWKWNWKVNLLAFFSPCLLCGIVILVGLLFNGVVYQGVDNAATFLLGIFGDIPAIFFFSATTFLLEEIIFRGYVHSYLSTEHGFIVPALVTSGLWGLLFYINFFDIQQLSFSSVIAGYINLISIGFVCSSLVYYSTSIWSSYSFRVGLATFLIPLLSGKQDDANSFFLSDFSVFSNSGILLTLLLVIFGICISKLSKPSKIAHI
jgi:membrane protease YdiL (CAAX protease family)